MLKVLALRRGLVPLQPEVDLPAVGRDLTSMDMEGRGMIEIENHTLSMQRRWP
jgi:hypothetical protein